MKITKVRTVRVSYRLEQPMWDAQSLIPARGSVLVLVDTDEGITGIGETSGIGGRAVAAQAVIESIVKPLVVGQEPFFVESIWQRVFQSTVHVGRRGLIIAALSGVDIAIWDVVGKALGQPLYKVLGASRDRVRAYASAGFYAEGKGVERLAEEMSSHVQAGYTACKIKVGWLPVRQDVERLTMVREAIGDGVDLMMDANNNLSPKAAIDLAHRAEDLGIFWFEEPTKTDDIDGSAQVAATVSMPVAGYETESTRYGFRELIARRAVDIVQPDCILSGGVTECRRIAGMASAFGLPCAPHVFSTAISMAANLHLLASAPNGLILEMDRNPNPLREELVTQPFRIEGDGYVRLPLGPGLGIELNWDAVDKYRATD